MFDSELDVVRREIAIDARPERVFDAWADPEELAHWYVDHAEGDPRRQNRVTWFVDGEAFSLEVNQCEPPHRLALTNAGGQPWTGSVLDVELAAGPGATRTSVVQGEFAESLRERVPVIDAGWACALAVLKEYLEHYRGQPLHKRAAKREAAIDPERAADALASVEAIERWAGVEVRRLLASTPYGAVAALGGYPGIFMLTAVRSATVRHLAWGSTEAASALREAGDLADRFVARTRALGQQR